MRTILRRTIIAAVVFALAFRASPTQAAPRFHLGLTRSEPMKDSTVTSPKAIKLWFSEKPSLAVSKVTLTGPGASIIPLGKPTMDTLPKSPIVASITSTLAPGVYTVHWTTASADGHAVTGDFAFTVRAAK